MKLAQLLRSSSRDASLTVNQWAEMFGFTYNGLAYNQDAYTSYYGGSNQPQPTETVGAHFKGYVDALYKTNGVVFSCMAVRQRVFSEARFQFRQRINGRPGRLFGTQALAPLEIPWEGGTTGDLLARMASDVDLTGNFFGTSRGNAIRRLRPDWVTIITGSSSGSPIDTEIVGYAYQEGGPHSGYEVEILLPNQVAHFAPIPDPCARFRGMSWLAPIVDEVLADKAATRHKRQFFDAGAQLGYVVTMDPEGKMDEAAFKRWTKLFKAQHEGIENAYKTLFLTRGADVKVVGADLKQIDFTTVQGHGETRICSAAGVPPIIAGVSEGLDAATYSNYAQARRAFADMTLRPLWRNAAAALAQLISVPSGSELWYDDNDIPFLQEDMQDEAQIQQMQAAAIRQLVDSGYTPDSVVAAVTAGDLSLLSHSGLYSVQLQPAGSTPIPAVAGTNGRRLLAQHAAVMAGD